MCGCNNTSNFYPPQGSVPYNRVNTQIGLNGLPFKNYVWQSGLTGDEIRQRCQNDFTTPEEIQRCIAANLGDIGEASGSGSSFWNNLWGGIQGFFAGYGTGNQLPSNNPNYPPTPVPDKSNKMNPWAVVGIVGAVLVVGGVAWYAVKKNNGTPSK